jgi:addiction module RelE/StbE family toxin
MTIRYASSFKRMYKKLSSEQRDGVDAALQLFAEDPFHARLRNHKLAGSQEGVRSIRAGYDLRILYVEENDHQIILLLKVGTHDAVY